MFKKSLGSVLNAANSSPDLVDRFWFYGMKDRILKRFGKRVAWDKQHIVKECWSCFGSGSYSMYESCWKCRGTGVFDEFWVLLEVWNLGGYEFHRPVERIWKGEYFTVINGLPSVLCDFRNKIEGVIRHDRHTYAKAAFWLLAWMFTPSKSIRFLSRWYWRRIKFKCLMHFRKIRHYGLKWRNDDSIPF